VRDWEKLVADFTRPLLGVPHHPVAMAFFGPPALLPARTLARTLFHDERARALFAGCAAHSVLPLTRVSTAATGLVLAAAGHTTGWPVIAGGAQSLTDALAAHLRSLGGRIELSAEVFHFSALPPADATLFDTGTSALERIAGKALSAAYINRLRGFRPGAGIFKIDYALSQPIPWRAPACLRAATVHVGGTLDEIAHSEGVACGLDPSPNPQNTLNAKPFVLAVQPSLFDPSRAPLAASGKTQHTAWAYCHVPAGSTVDHTAVIEAQMERFAPGFKDCVLARRPSNPAALAAWDPNLAGGDVSGGAMTLMQLVFRPTPSLYRTSHPRIYLASASTPPGGGVHGMCGHWAAMAALRDHGH
jgi:phytoene dehydrogenase-like protein